MPPSHHSSSSHSSHSSSHSSHSSGSSHSFSSSSHSSHSSSSHYSSSYSSHSSRSSSSYSGSSYRSSGSSYSSHSRRPSSTSYRIDPTIYVSTRKTRTNQPTGYNKGNGSVQRTIYGQSHDYVYYPETWTNKEGVTYKGGYYDENGTYYENVAVENETTVFTCKYCGNKKKMFWNEGSVPTCENCGAVFQIDASDKKEKHAWKASPTQVNNYYYVNQTKKKSHKWLVVLIVLFVLYCIGKSEEDDVYRDYDYDNNYDYVENDDSTQDSIYVRELGRTCYMYEGDYYDEVTECWFYYFEDYDVWQYWYQDISSNYGDYGWMEYDYDEERWYIEVDDGQWEVLDDSYVSDRLWHFE